MCSHVLHMGLCPRCLVSLAGRSSLKNHECQVSALLPAPSEPLLLRAEDRSADDDESPAFGDVDATFGAPVDSNAAVLERLAAKFAAGKDVYGFKRAHLDAVHSFLVEAFEEFERMRSTKPDVNALSFLPSLGSLHSTVRRKERNPSITVEELEGMLKA